nr:MAG TPA: Lipase chaperone A, Lipase interaction domain [Bacteriophage sp.]
MTLKTSFDYFMSGLSFFDVLEIAEELERILDEQRK